MSDMPEVGKAAPKFTLPAFPEGKVALKDFAGQNVILYFYPKDNTPGCTTESCDFRDNKKAIDKHDAVIFGISPDSVKSHEKFVSKFDLPFQLLADEDHKISEKYGVWVEKSMYGKKYMGIQRATFLINKKGKIAEVWPKVKVKGHVDEVLEKLAELD